jgi:hypothetical protein
MRFCPLLLTNLIALLMPVKYVATLSNQRGAPQNLKNRARRLRPRMGKIYICAALQRP